MSQRQTVEFLYPMWTIVEAPEGPPGMQGYIVRQRVEYRPIMPPVVDYLVAMPDGMSRWVYEADVIVAASPKPWVVAAARPQGAAGTVHVGE